MNIEMIILLEAIPKAETTIGFDFKSLIAPLISLIGAIIVGFISKRASNASVAVSRSIGEQNLKALDKSRFIEIVSKNRAKWIEDVRSLMSQYNETIYLKSSEMLMIKDGVALDLERVKRLDSFHVKLAHEARKLILYLNPSEVVSRNFLSKNLEAMNIILMDPQDIKDNYNHKKMVTINSDLIYLQGVILKAEWRRLKLEVEWGRELTTDEFQEVCDTIARKQSLNKYLDIFVYCDRKKNKKFTEKRIILKRM
ncbi:hypothetical protein QNH35_13840 [Bacillus pumilus]|uniref:hypothetical protein n=1 Tax=Bacillus pumilus TaxID=1408 RepID=UPI0024C1225B|nr:hypothetical protein [Bacillus pumilus]WHX43802.1 hypothetical protein QNH35_13840 [Bacillus pumilus]